MAEIIEKRQDEGAWSYYVHYVECRHKQKFVTNSHPFCLQLIDVLMSGQLEQTLIWLMSKNQTRKDQQQTSHRPQTQLQAENWLVTSNEDMTRSTTFKRFTFHHFQELCILIVLVGGRRSKVCVGERTRRDYKGQEHRCYWTWSLWNWHMVLLSLPRGVFEYSQALFMWVLFEIHEETKNIVPPQGKKTFCVSIGADFV